MKTAQVSLLIILSTFFIMLPPDACSQERNKQPEEQPAVLQNPDGKEPNQEELLGVQQESSGRQGTPYDTPGKVVVIGPDGKKLELDTSGADSVILKQTIQSITENGEQQMRVQGKAIMIGPDGTRTEFDLAKPLEMNQDLNDLGLPSRLDRVQRLLKTLPENAEINNLLPQHRFAMPMPWQPKRRDMGEFTIGLKCSRITEALRHHLDLNNQNGLIVDKVDENSPAAKAGVQQYDILLYADQEDLISVQNLTNVVTKAGNEGLPLSLNLLRKGKELGIEVEPIKRATDAQSLGRGLWSPIAPDLIIGGELELEDFDQRIQQLKEQMQKQMEEMHEQMRLLRDQTPENGSDRSGF